MIINKVIFNEVIFDEVIFHEVMFDKEIGHLFFLHSFGFEELIFDEEVFDEVSDSPHILAELEATHRPCKSTNRLRDEEEFEICFFSILGNGLKRFSGSWNIGFKMIAINFTLKMMMCQ